MMSKKLGVICLKWGHKFSAEYVNVLYRAVRGHLSLPHEFVCVTDDAEGLDPGVIVLQRQLRRMKQSGYWAKVVTYDQEVSGRFDLALYLDLDMVITGSLDPIFALLERDEGFYMMPRGVPLLARLLPERLRPDRGGNSSVVAFCPKRQEHLYRAFDPVKHPREFANDQDYVTAKSNNYRLLPRKWCPSFKEACVYRWPLGLVFTSYPKPRGALIVVFYGRPNPTELISPEQGWWGSKRHKGKGPVKWVQDYWRTYGDDKLQHV